MNHFIVDASVINKYIIDSEESSEIAKNIFQLFVKKYISISLPSLWYYEVGNVIKRFNKIQFTEIFALLTEMNFDVYDFSAIEKQKILKLSLQFNTSYYDMSYLFLAQNLDAQLITADERFYNAINKKKTFKGNIILLKDFKF